MAEYKDVEQIKKRVREDCNGCWNRNSPSKCPDDCGVIEAIRAIDSVPSTDAVPVRHGKWEWISSTYDRIPCEKRYQCSKCHHETITHESDPWEKFCPYCGARMDGKDSDRHD